MSIRLPLCDFCKHYIDNAENGKMCCNAFLDGIPLEKIRLEDDETECANGIKYEEDYRGVIMKEVKIPDFLKPAPEHKTSRNL